MFRDAWLVTKKDLLIELRSRILINQIAPYTLLILVLFGFALDADTETLRDTGPGLFWVSTLLVAILAIQRSVDLETSDSAVDRLLLYRNQLYLCLSFYYLLPQRVELQYQ